MGDMSCSKFSTIISRVSQIDGVPMLDGGMADALPIGKIIEEGWNKVLVILTRKSNYRKKYRFFYMMMIRLVYHKYPDLLRQYPAGQKSTMPVLAKLSRWKRKEKH